MVRAINVVVLLGLVAAPAMAAFADEWAEAVGFAQKFGGSKEAGERATAASKLAVGMDGKHDKQAVQLLLTILGNECAKDGGGKKEDDVSGEVLLNCEDSLKKTGVKEAVDILIQQAKKNPNPRMRFHIARALGGVKGDDAIKALTELIADREPRVIIGAADGLAEQASESTLDAIVKAMKDKTVPWEAKLSLITACSKIDKPEKCMDGLIEALAAMPGDMGRLKIELIKLMGKFCGITDPKTDDAGWWKQAWADKKGGKNVATEGGTTVEPTEFFGLKSKSTRIVFVLDRTGSMDDPCTFPPEDPKKPPVRPVEATGGKKPDPAEMAAKAQADQLFKKWDDLKVTKKIEGLKKQFTRTIYGLDPRVSFAVVWYESVATPWKNELVLATWANKLDCLKEIDKLSPSGPTNVWSGLETAYKLVEQPNRPDVVAVDKKGNYATVIKGADTFFLMTDGNHNTGKFVASGGTVGTDVNAFIAEVKKVTAMRKVIIHVVALGDLGAGGDPLTQTSLNFLQKIANETGGEFKHVGK